MTLPPNLNYSHISNSNTTMNRIPRVLGISLWTDFPMIYMIIKPDPNDIHDYNRFPNDNKTRPKYLYKLVILFSLIPWTKPEWKRIKDLNQSDPKGFKPIRPKIDLKPKGIIDKKLYTSHIIPHQFTQIILYHLYCCFYVVTIRTSSSMLLIWLLELLLLLISSDS